jgi:hypothetical protein
VQRTASRIHDLLDLPGLAARQVSPTARRIEDSPTAETRSQQTTREPRGPIDSVAYADPRSVEACTRKELA